ncbi:MAG: hypothetical protein LBU23_11750, partial [Planctomycetota bacterium]|nr:hypothetical protein [Planctomycetota bacterium]
MLGHLTEPVLPLAVGDGYNRLPPFTQVLFTPTIVVTIIVFGIAVVVVVYFSYRNNRQKALQRREEALRLAKKLL